MCERSRLFSPYNADSRVFTLDTSSMGGSNAGREFGTDLSEAERWDLVEYLKTL